MKIIWDQEKSKKLILERNLSFEVFSDLILQKAYADILENPAHPDQMIFIIPFNKYTYVIPFIIDDDNSIVLKTIFPSRKFHKLYGGGNYEHKT